MENELEIQVITTKYLESSENYKKIAVSECLEIGGHCWRYDSEVFATNPPRQSRRCKHCDAMQIGTPQNDMRWEDSR